MSKEIDLLKNGFKFLKEDCGTVNFKGWTNKEAIPKSAKKITSDEEPKEYYEDLTSSEWDQADFWGRIYLPFDENDYMEFEVGA